jgi:putative ABC transport system permease protein
MRPPPSRFSFHVLHFSFREALTALASHKLRSALTLLGVLVGVFSIIVVMTAMRVMQSDIEKQLSGLGNLTFVVRKTPGLYVGGPDGLENYWRRKDITLPQGLELAERASRPVAVGVQAILWSGQVENRFKKTAPTVTLFGETAGSFSARNWTLKEGRLLMDTDVEGARDVCVLGDRLAKTLFPFGSPVGERVKMRGINYTVLGVLEAQGATVRGNQDNFAVVPITTGLNRFGRWARSLELLVQAASQADYEATVDEARGILRVLRKVPPGKPDDFEIFSNDSMIKEFNSFTKAVRIGVLLISSIALLAAGIGIMNIMLVSVTERTREIGLRRAVGAKKRNILAQFIMEAVVICEIGGALGVILGILGGNALAYFLNLSPVVPVDWVILGLVICSVVGVVFGTYPAYKAANLDPIESLRYE